MSTDDETYIANVERIVDGYLAGGLSQSDALVAITLLTVELRLAYTAQSEVR